MVMSHVNQGLLMVLSGLINPSKVFLLNSLWSLFGRTNKENCSLFFTYHSFSISVWGCDWGGELTLCHPTKTKKPWSNLPTLQLVVDLINLASDSINSTTLALNPFLATSFLRTCFLFISSQSLPRLLSPKFEESRVWGT